jgi:hypothetical protein
MAALKDSYARQVQFTELMCAATGAGGDKEREFDESKVKRAGGKFATRAEKAQMAADEQAANQKAFNAAPPGVVKLPDGKTAYKLSDEETKAATAALKNVTDFFATAIKAASSDPGSAPAHLGELADSLESEVAKAKDGARKNLMQMFAPAKAQAAAQATNLIATNLSDDQVKKGLVQVTKQLNSGKPSKPEQVMKMVKDWAAQAQKNIDSGIKSIKSAGSAAKAKALAAGVGLMTKISEMAAAAANSDAGKVIGNAYNAASKAIGDKVEEAGFSRDIKSLPGDFNQVGKDLAQDAKETADKIGKVVTSPNFAAHVAVSTGLILADGVMRMARAKAGIKQPAVMPELVKHLVVSNIAHRAVNDIIPIKETTTIEKPTTPKLINTVSPKPTKMPEPNSVLEKSVDLAVTTAKAAATKGLVGSVVGAAIGGVAGGIAAGPPGFIAGIPIGRDLGGAIGTLKGMRDEYEDRAKSPTANANRKSDIDSILADGQKVADAASKLVTKLAEEAPKVIHQVEDATKQLSESAKTAAKQASDLTAVGVKNATFVADRVGKGAARLNKDLEPVAKAGVKLLGDTAQAVKTTYENRQIDTSEPGIYGVKRGIDKFLADPQTAIDKGMLDGKKKTIELRREAEAKLLEAKQKAEDIQLAIQESNIKTRAASRNFNNQVTGGVERTGSDLEDGLRGLKFDVAKVKDELGLGVNLLGTSLSRKRLAVQKEAQQQSAERRRNVEKAKIMVANSPLGSLAKAANAERVKLQRSFAS